MEKCYILFGSNMGDKEGCFADACSLINNRCGQVTGLSDAFESEPWGFEADEWFLNRVIEVETELDPEEMLTKLLDIEASMGRVRHPEIKGYSSRPVDLDILYFGDRIIRTEFLTVPHPRLHLRRFALEPICQLIPEHVHPVLQQTQQELLEACPDRCIVRKMEMDNSIKV